MTNLRISRGTGLYIKNYITISGLLVVQDFEDDRDTQDYKKQEGPIRIVEVSDLDNRIQDLVKERIAG